MTGETKNMGVLQTSVHIQTNGAQPVANVFIAVPFSRVGVVVDQMNGVGVSVQATVHFGR
jgi:hypothetical protein